MTKLKLETGSVQATAADTIALLVGEKHSLSESGRIVDERLNGEVTRIVSSEAFAIKPRNAQIYYASSGQKRFRLILTAAPSEVPRPQRLREAAFTAVQTARTRAIREVLLAFDPADSGEIQAIGEGALLATYNYRRFKSKKESKPGVSRIRILADSNERFAINRANVLATASLFVRDLVNEPPNLLTPQRLAEIARDVAGNAGLQLRIYGRKELEKMGANAFLSVGKGSNHPPQMIQLSYKPQKRAAAHIALVGKGITFDSGGLSLKTQQGMEHMKTDMAGAAIVLACVQAVAELKLPVRVTSLLMATENMPNGGANRPGDVVRAMNGKTIEITNTDAEGRLALADGLQFAQQLNPDYLIDVATLTGAQVISLGRLMAGVMGNNSEFIQQMVEAGKKAGELVWPLPLYEPYRDLIKSDVADMRNSSGIPEAPTIQAGLFLSEFVSHPRWLHMDIAGPSWQEREWGVYTKAASGFGARCILTFLLDHLTT